MKDRISEMLSTGGYYTLDLYRKVDANISFHRIPIDTECWVSVR